MMDGRWTDDNIICCDEIVIRIPSSQIDYTYYILNSINEADLVSCRFKSVKVYNTYFKTMEIQLNTLITA